MTQYPWCQCAWVDLAKERRESGWVGPRQQALCLCFEDDREHPASCFPVKLEGAFFTVKAPEMDLGCDLGGEYCVADRAAHVAFFFSSLRNLGFRWG